MAATDRISRVLLRWRRSIPEDVVILGDAWERAYGDLQWRGMQPERVLPWTALWHHAASGATTGVGVEVRGGAFAGWTVDPEGVSLWLDLRCGGVAVRPAGRVIDAAVVREVAGTGSPFVVHQLLCAALCADALSTGPLVGANNWYYAYGLNFDAAAVLRDARTWPISSATTRCGRSRWSTTGGAGRHRRRPSRVGWAVGWRADGRLPRRDVGHGAGDRGTRCASWHLVPSAVVPCSAGRS